MPELPEVETTRRGLSPYLQGQTVQQLIVYNSQLRWPVPPNLPSLLRGTVIQNIERRSKYLLLDVGLGTVLIHLGMSGSLRIAEFDSDRRKHDHIELLLSNGTLVRYHDPRRFGCWLWTTHPVTEHPLLQNLGPEPLEKAFSSRYFTLALAKRSQAVKLAIMDNRLVVGVGNIYANEALFYSHIHPERPANTLNQHECATLHRYIQQVLKAAIRQGGTTLKDYVNGSGNPGYFAQKLLVYGRSGQDCLHCKAPLVTTRIGQRTTVYCPACQH